MTEQLITFQTDPRAAALELLDRNSLDPSKIIRQWDNGDLLGWALLTEEDTRPKDFVGLKLVFRTLAHVVTVIVSKEQIEDDESGQVIEGLIDELRKSSLPR